MDLDNKFEELFINISTKAALSSYYFVGKKALLNSDKSTLLFGFKCSEKTPSSGSVIIHDNEDVGYITAGVDSPTLKCGIGYVRFSEKGEWIGKKLNIKFRDGSISSGEVVEFPFFDREKLLLKGIKDKALED